MCPTHTSGTTSTYFLGDVTSPNYWGDEKMSISWCVPKIPVVPLLLISQWCYLSYLFADVMVLLLSPCEADDEPLPSCWFIAFICNKQVPLCNQKFNTVSEHRLYYVVTKYSDHGATGSKGSKGTDWLCLVPTGGCIPIQCYLKKTHITIQSIRCWALEFWEICHYILLFW